MTEPIFWLGCSFLLVAVSLTAVLVSAIPALQELGRAARSAEKLFDTLYRELPPTLEAIRLTGLEISDLTDDIGDGVESAGNVAKQVDQGLRTAQRQVQDVGIAANSVLVGVQAAWKSLTRSSGKRRRRNPQNPSNPRRTALGEPHFRSGEQAAVPYDREWPSESSERHSSNPHPSTSTDLKETSLSSTPQSIETFLEDPLSSPGSETINLPTD